MMTKVSWTENALQDILEIYTYIAQDSPNNADSFLDSLMDNTEKQLSISPLIGRKIPEINDPAFREIIYGNYRVMYHIECSQIDITHVRHGAREFLYE
jgi:addiction module RelE/StbE family toxin